MSAENETRAAGVTPEFIEGIQLFTGLAPAVLEGLAALARVEEYSPGGVIFREGEPRRALTHVTAGRIDVSTGSATGEEQQLLSYTVGDVLGEGVLIEGSLHASTGVAAEPTRLTLFRREALVEFFGRTEHREAQVTVLRNALELLTRRLEQAGFAQNPEARQYASGATRTERDLLGSVEVPRDVYWGVQTKRALDNFNISGRRLSAYPELPWALATVKLAAARANRDCGVLDAERAEAIEIACEEIRSGRLRAQFALDVLQGGAGTSTNMNANEVIANRALMHLGRPKGDYATLDPNDHVNRSQSTNDFYPTSLKLAMLRAGGNLFVEVRGLAESLAAKSGEFAGVLKMGRTQLQDAVPMTLGQEFGAFSQSVLQELDALEQSATRLLSVNMGGTAIGTGLNAPDGYAEACVEHLREVSGFDFALSENLIEATQDTQGFVLFSACLKSLAVKLSKIASDLRLLSSGPRAGLNEINLPAVQPGSSIMPGKVNPVIPEVVNQVAYHVIGNDLTVTLAAEAGQLQLNVMEPIIGACILESCHELTAAARTFRALCIEGITANEREAMAFVERSIGVVTALVPRLGYRVCSKLATKALAEDRGIVELVREQGLLTDDEIVSLLSPEAMVRNPDRGVQRNGAAD